MFYLLATALHLTAQERILENQPGKQQVSLNDAEAKQLLVKADTLRQFNSLDGAITTYADVANRKDRLA